MNIAELYSWYTKTPTYLELADNSKRIYTAMVKTAIDYFKDKDVLTIKAGNADDFYYHIKNTKGLHRAEGTTKVLRRMWNIAMRYELVTHNPFLSMKIEKPPSRTEIWTPLQVINFYMTSIKMNLKPIGIMIITCYDMMQRPGDVRKLKWDNYSLIEVIDDGKTEVKGYLDFIQEKTKVKINCPVTKRVQNLFDDCPRYNEFIFNRVDNNQPYDDKLFIAQFHQIAKRSGLPYYLQVRDLRRSGMTEMRAKGAPDYLIKQISGHLSDSVLPVYLIRTVELAEQAMKYRDVK